MENVSAAAAAAASGEVRTWLRRSDFFSFRSALVPRCCAIDNRFSLFEKKRQKLSGRNGNAAVPITSMDKKLSSCNRVTFFFFLFITLTWFESKSKKCLFQRGTFFLNIPSSHNMTFFFFLLSV